MHTTQQGAFIKNGRKIKQLPKMQSAVFDECSSNCKTPPQNIFEPRNFGIKKDNGTKNSHCTWNEFIWRPVKCFWTQKHFLNQNHFWILKIFALNVVLRKKICSRSKLFSEPKIYLDLHSILQSKILVKLKRIGFIFTNYFLPQFCSVLFR